MNLQQNNYTYHLHFKPFILILFAVFLFYGCQDSLDSMSTTISNESTNNISAGKSTLSIEVSDRSGYEFKVLDATGFVGKPDMRKYGIRPIVTLRPRDIWKSPRNKKNRWDFAPEDQATEAAHKAADKYKSRTIMGRIGHWPTSADAETVQRSTSHYSRLYHDLNRAETKIDFGFFDIPIRGWWTNDPAPKWRNRWHKKNDRLKNLAKKVDAFYLKGYAISKNQERWVRNMKMLIEEAKRIGNGQPIYLVLWPEYYAARDKSLKHKYIGRPFWQRMLDTAKKYADGVVLYAPSGSKWNTNAAWWNTTKRFMEELGEYSPDPKVSNSEFKVFDGTRYWNKTNMDQLGFTPFEIVYAGRIWDKPLGERGKWELPSRRLVKTWAGRASEENNNITMLNVEHWPTSGSDYNVQKSVDCYSTVYEWFKNERPNMKVGYFDTVPRKIHWRKYPQRGWLKSINEKNKRLEQLANKVDVFYPQAYTYTNDREGWLINTKYMLKQVHQYSGDKPVYLMLWPQYYEWHNSSLKGKYIDKEFWKLQLETARRYADGIVIWLPKTANWSEAESAPWWDVTKGFLRNMGKTK